MAQMAVAWVLQNDNVASAITGGSRPEQVKANAAAAGKSLSARDTCRHRRGAGRRRRARRLVGRVHVAEKRPT